MVGINAAYLVSRFTTIKMLSRFRPLYVWNAGKPTMKFINISSHGSLEIDKEASSP
jgi:hypothetical protein